MTDQLNLSSSKPWDDDEWEKEWKVWDNIREHESFNEKVDSIAKAFDRLWKWASMPSWLIAKPAGESQGNGLFTTRYIKKDETVLEIPSHLMLKSSSVTPVALRNDPLLKAFPTVALVIVLLRESSNITTSKYAPYINTLPPFVPLPMYYTTSQMKDLKRVSKPAFDAVKQMTYHVLKQFQYCQKSLKLEYSLKQFCWAMSIAVSRQNEVQSGVMALVPGWDLGNHEAGEITTMILENTGVLKCTAKRDFSTNDQVSMCYGKRSNIDFLVYSGFVPFENPYDVLSVPVNVPRDSLYKLRAGLLKSYTYFDAEVVVLNVRLDQDEEKSAVMTIRFEDFQALCVLYMPKPELASLLRLKPNAPSDAASQDTMNAVVLEIQQAVRAEMTNSEKLLSSSSVNDLQTLLEQKLRLCKRYLEQQRP